LVAVACGIDWAQEHHDVAVVDDLGVVLASVRVGNDAAGLRQVLTLLAEHDPDDGQIPVAIETSQGLLVAGLRAAGRQIYPINPLAVSRYRDRYRASGGKSDAFDAMVLANILRTDAPAHRPLPADSLLLQSLRVLTRRSRTQPGTRSPSPTGSVRCYASSFRLRWPRSNAADGIAWTHLRPGPS
jgi:transposase